jgi:four helix bundle protein
VGLPHASSFRDLVVYQKARQLSRALFVVSKEFPREEMYSLTDQVRRSSRSIGAHIAEAWGKRRYERYFVSKLTDADGEQRETQHWIEVARDCNYVTAKQAADLLQDCEEVGRLLGSMINKAHLFCSDSSRTLREETLDYFIGNHS